MNKTVREIVKEYLKQNNYDGLFSEYCGCTIDDLFPCCDATIYDCAAGYKIKCDPETCELDGDCDFHIGVKDE